MSEKAQVVFSPSGRHGRFALGTTLLEAARSLGVDLDSVCAGRGLCGRCQIEVGEGECRQYSLTSCADHVSAPAAAEERYGERHGLDANRRLACHARILGDLLVHVPPESQIHKQVVRKRAEARPIELDPLIRLHYVEVERPDMAKQSAELRRLKWALAKEWGLEGLSADLHVLRSLDKALGGGGYGVTVAVRNGKRVVRVQPGFHDQAYGLAVDVGSTTIAAHLCDLSSGKVLASGGAMNPQTRFGEDVMSRVSHIQLHPGGGAELTKVVRQAINKLAGATAAEAGVRVDDILEVTLVGNPVMHHLLLGIDPTPLGSAPFTLATDEALEVDARDIGLNFNPGARAYILPCIAGHVGADTAGVLLSEQPYKVDELTLIADIGTNAELVLGNRHRLLAASSPTGPAFEGAQISCGQRAASGAIERVRIDPESLEPRFKVIGSDLWSDDPGFVASPTGVCGSGIIEAIAAMYLAGIVTRDGIIDGAMAARTQRVVPQGRVFAYVLHDAEPRLVVTQHDVRAIQLAKAALHAGARLLMERFGVDRVERIVLAGAFGSYIDVRYAMVLGMIPDCDLEKVSSAGNAAGTGARIALLNRRARAEIEEVVRRVEKVETAAEADFERYFVEAMTIPHRTAAYPSLAGVFPMAARRLSPAEGVSHRRRNQPR